MRDRFSRVAARARERQLLAQQRIDATFWRADRIADRLEELRPTPRVHRIAEADAFELLAQHRLRTARARAAAAAEGFAEARCDSGAYLLSPLGEDDARRS